MTADFQAIICPGIAGVEYAVHPVRFVERIVAPIAVARNQLDLPGRIVPEAGLDVGNQGGVLRAGEVQGNAVGAGSEVSLAVLTLRSAQVGVSR